MKSKKLQLYETMVYMELEAVSLVLIMNCVLATIYKDIEQRIENRIH